MKQTNTGHPRPRIGKTRDDKLPADKRTRGGRADGRKPTDGRKS